MKPAFKWIFATSMILNLFLAGFIIGNTAPPKRGIAFNKGNLSELAPEKREIVENMMDRMRERRKEDYRKIKHARKEVADILEAPTFDEVKFIEKSKALDALFSNSKQQMIEEMAAIAKGFNQKERHVLAEQLRRPPAQPKGKPTPDTPPPK